MRRWLRVLVVGVLTVLLSIDSASACRFLRSRCRPRCRVVTCRVVRQATHHCMPCDGSAHAVIIESSPVLETAPVVEHHHAPTPLPATPSIAETPTPATPQPVKEPLQPLEPIAPVSAEKPLTPPTPPVPPPQFKSAAEILAESAEQERMEKAALEASKPAAPPAAEPQFKTAAEILAESAAQHEAEQAATAAAMKKAAEEAPAHVDEPAAPAEPTAEPAPQPTPKKPVPRPAEENLFDEADDEPAAAEPTADTPAPMKKAPAEEPVEDLFGEPEAGTPAEDEDKAPAAKEPADEAPTEEEKTEKAVDDPFAVFEASPEPVRRWIDSTGRHQTIGRLVEVHPDRVRILKSNGHCTTVPLDRLSRHDQSYVTQVGERIAAKRPAVTDTAQR